MSSNSFSALGEGTNAPAPQKKVAAQAAPVQQQQTSSRGGASSGGRGGRGGRGASSGGRGGSRGGRGGRGGGRSNGDTRPVKHDGKDRQSSGARGGRGGREKRNGGGKFNWGDKEQQPRIFPREIYTAADAEAADPDAAPEKEGKSYDEYLAEKEANAAASELKLREVSNEKFDKKLFKAVTTKKPFVPQNIKQGKKKGNKAAKMSLDQFTSSGPAKQAQASTEGQRGQRGGRKGGAKLENLNDNSAFPTLGGK